MRMSYCVLLTLGMGMGMGMALSLCGCGRHEFSGRTLLTRQKMAVLYKDDFEQRVWELGWKLTNGRLVSTQDVIEQVGEPDYKIAPSKPAELKDKILDDWFAAGRHGQKSLDLRSLEVWFWHPAIRAQNPRWADWYVRREGLLAPHLLLPPSLTLLVADGRVLDFASGKLGGPVEPQTLQQAISGQARLKAWLTVPVKIKASVDSLTISLSARAVGVVPLECKRAVLRVAVRDTVSGSIQAEQDFDLPEKAWKVLSANVTTTPELSVKLDTDRLAAAVGGHLITTGTLLLYAEPTGDKLVDARPIVLVPQDTAVR